MQFLLKKSLEEALPVEIIYQGRDSEFTKRTIVVKGINDTYIKAFCLTKRKPRIFKIDSILAVSPVRTPRRTLYA